ncbi:MAG: hypothetical protein GX196_04495 [Clostridiaceae bacterium]|nr:hypothetical protein [Clostridiaceae bacterium]
MLKRVYYIITLAVICLCAIFLPKIPVKTQAKGELYINIENKPIYLSPVLAKTQDEKKIISCLYEGLFKINIDGKTIGSQAKSYSVSDDFLTYKINLRGTTWSDGSDLTSYDFQSSWLYALTNLGKEKEELFIIKNAKEYSEGLVNKEDVGILCPDSLTIIVTLNEPDPSFIEKLSRPVFMPQKGNLTNGPYVIKNITSDGVFLEKNPYYWDKSSISIYSLNFVLSGKFKEINPQTFIFDGEGGEFDGAQKRYYDTGEVSYVIFNSQKLNKEKRLYLQNKIQNLKEILADEFFIQNGFVNDLATGKKAFYRIEHEAGFEYESAKEAQFNPLNLIYEKDNETPFLNILKTHFEKEGILINLTPLTQKEFAQREEAGDFDLAYKVFAFSVGTPYEQLAVFKSGNPYQYKNKNFDTLLNQALHSKREDLFDILYDAEVELVKNPPAVAVLNFKKPYYTSPDLKNVLRLGYGAQNLDLYFAKIKN